MKLLIFETHPIQYRAPIYQRLQEIRPNLFEVVYASDFSVRGYKDQQFGTTVSWDIPLLGGYPFTVLGTDAEGGINSWRGLRGSGVRGILRARDPQVILMSSFNYSFSLAVFLQAIMLRKKLWIRVETQDLANSRSFIKSLIRTPIYKAIYRFVDHAFSIGTLNREHLLRHGIATTKISSCHYCTRNPLGEVDEQDKTQRREELRKSMQIEADICVVSFFGKFIPKKNPSLILQALKNLARSASQRYACLLVGSGELEPELRTAAKELELLGIRCVFPGFVNQSALADYYLASDIVVMPSRRAGETWGLIANEALHAGCGVVLSDAVGSSRDFSGLERVRIFSEGNGRALEEAIVSLAGQPRNFDWAKQPMANYSIEAAAAAIADQIDRL